MLILALPGSTNIYQGEELGLFEVADLPGEVLQDPIWERDNHTSKGRNGCRVPLPWESSGSSFGFGANGAHLPQPEWFGDLSVAAESGVDGSTLELYRTALALRKQQQGAEEIRWIDSQSGTVHFVRPGGWHCIMNFGNEPQPLPKGTVLLSSAPISDGVLPGSSAAWIRISE